MKKLTTLMNEKSSLLLHIGFPNYYMGNWHNTTHLQMVVIYKQCLIVLLAIHSPPSIKIVKIKLILVHDTIIQRCNHIISLVCLGTSIENLAWTKLWTERWQEQKDRKTIRVGGRRKDKQCNPIISWWGTNNSY